MELTKADRLYLFGAYKKKVDEKYKAFKQECDAEFLDEYRETGSTTKRSALFGKKAGSYYIPIKEATEAHEEVEFNLADDEELANWLTENPEAAERYAILNAIDFGRFWLNWSGELPDGLTMVRYDVPGLPEQPGTPTLKVNADVVAEKVEGGLLEGAARLLLGDGE